MQQIPFNKPFLTGAETQYLNKAMENRSLSGDGEFTLKSSNWLELNLGAKKALLTQSCTAALEMSAILSNVEPGDEVIMPSYTFVSTANAFVLRGAVPVFADCRQDNANIDENKIEELLTARTKAIVAVHYAGMSCNMTAISNIAKSQNLTLIEDAAQGIGSTYKGKPLGTIGDLGTLSFHATKNVISGEGGALLINNSDYELRAEVIREKGTDRSSFLRGEKDKYTWRDLGSSYLPSELTAAFLWAQLAAVDQITNIRREIWRDYHSGFRDLAKEGFLEIPDLKSIDEGNGHIFFILLENPSHKQDFISHMRSRGIGVATHYEPLHKSPAGLKYGKTPQKLQSTEYVFERLVRLPIYPEMRNNVQQIVDAARSFLKKSAR